MELDGRSVDRQIMTIAQQKSQSPIEAARKELEEQDTNIEEILNAVSQPPNSAEDDIINLAIDVDVKQAHLQMMTKLEGFDKVLSSQIERIRQLVAEDEEKKKNGEPRTLLGMMGTHIKQFQGFKKSFEEFKFPVNKIKLTNHVVQEVSHLEEVWGDGFQEEMDRLEEEVGTLQERIETENKQFNDSLRNSNVESNVSYEQLETKRKFLEDNYSQKIMNLCASYGISVSDVNITEDMFTASTLNKMYDDFIKFMKKDSKKVNPITLFKQYVPSVIVQGCILLVLLIICFTVILDASAILLFGFLAFYQYRNVKRVEYYSILMGLVFNVNPKALGYHALDESQLLPEELTDEMMDNDPRFIEVVERMLECEERWEAKNPAPLRGKVTTALARRNDEIDSLINDCRRAFDGMHSAIISDIESELNYLNKLYDKLKDEFETIGSVFEMKKLAMSESFVLGLTQDFQEERIEIGKRNLIIRPSADTEKFKSFIQLLVANAFSNIKPDMLTLYVYDPNNFGQIITPMYTADLRERIIFENDDLKSILEKLTDEVQENFKILAGKTFSEFNTECETSGVTPLPMNLLLILSQPKTIEEDEKLQNFFEYSYKGGTYIWAVSDSMQSKDAQLFRIPYERIRCPILVNGEWCKKFGQNLIDAISKAKPKALLWWDFIDQIFKGKGDGHEQGRKNLWFGNASEYIDFYPGFENGDPSLFKPYTLGNEGNVHAIGVGTSGAGKSVFLNHLLGTMCRLFDPSQLELWLCDFKGVEFKAYMKTPRTKAARFCKPIKAEEGYTPRFEEKRKEVLGYYKYNPETKEYTYSKEPTGDCTELHVFMQDIDKKTKQVKIKNGKEAEPVPKPDTDYADNMESYCLPHIAACLCTSDGDFATSLFKAYRDKADARYEDMKILGVKNMPGWNARVGTLIGMRKPDKLIEAHGEETGFNPIWSEDDLWPRVLFICDEFQVIFQKADANNVERIKADITQIAKVARACGMHIFFTSQSMKGTISSDILANFTLRFALRCEPEVSQDIIGSTRAAEIREKNGYLITKSLEMKTPEEQKKYKTPFLDDSEGSGVMTTSQLFDNIRELYLLAQERGFKEKDVISYEESTVHPYGEMEEFFNNPVAKEKLPESGVLLLGPRMAYSANRAPDNVILSATNNSNVYSVFEDTKDLVTFFKQFCMSMSLNKVPGNIIINTQVADLAYLTAADEYVTNEKQKALLSEKNSPAEVLDWVERLYNHRVDTGSKSTPIWVVLLGWDKAPGIGLDPDYAVKGKLTTLLNTVGEYNIHFVMINSGMGAINSTLITAFKVLIAGKVSVDDSMSLLSTKQAGVVYDSMPNGYIFVKREGVISRDKLYRFPIERKIAAKEIVF